MVGQCFHCFSSSQSPVSAANWKNDLQCRRGPNALQNTLSPTSHSYQRKTTNKPSLNLQSTKPSTNVACHYTWSLMDRVVMGFVVPRRIKFFVTLWAKDFLQLVFPSLICNITTTSSSNAVFPFRITHQAASIDQAMFCNGISA